MGPSDGELVERARKGDRDAFRQLVERYQRKIATLALGMLRNREDALDVVQETFTKAFQSLDRFKGDAGFYTWTYRIAVNLCIDHQRREAKMPLATLEPREGETGGRIRSPSWRTGRRRAIPSSALVMPRSRGGSRLPSPS